MSQMPFAKYRPFAPVPLRDRQWPNQMLQAAPIWCSVDLRDGNQALVEPMNIDKKLKMFNLLVKLGFKEIEVGFPAASETEYTFLRTLIDQNLIPEDVTIQVLTQAREHLLHRTFEALKGCKQAILHLYNSTSTLQRRVVFRMDKPEIVDLAVRGTKLVKELVQSIPDTKVRFEYSPESFTGTEIDFAVEICEAVMEAWEPTAEEKMILNLPATVEMSTPNTYADQVEWFCRKLRDRDKAIISLHTHNDRGTAVAAAELGLMAGGDRIEGTLFGNGERTGNVDIVTLALNLYTQGIDPRLDFSNIDEVIEIAEQCTNIPVHIRHPYSGDLVFTAFSGSHQDAINKGMADYTQRENAAWEVPYLPIDPADLGRNYEAIIRINSQSGKGGIAYILQKEFGFQLPKLMQQEFSRIIQQIADRTGKEVSSEMIWNAFFSEYLDQRSPLELKAFKLINESEESETVTCQATLKVNGNEQTITGQGNGPIDAFMKGLRQQQLVGTIRLIDYHEHALSQGADSKAVAYIQVQNDQGDRWFGAGVDTNINTASIKALVSALNRVQN